MNFKAIIASAAVAAATIVPAPAEAFWGPSDAQVCETNLSYIEEVRRSFASQVGIAVQFSGTVVPSGKANVAPLGYKFVTGCTTQFTMNGARYIQSANVESNGSQYYVNLAPAQVLQNF